jgi:hypothetical protein
MGGQLAVMATKGGKEQARATGKGRSAAPPDDAANAGRWKGDAVEDQHGDAAELAADRAEGNSTVRADVESERLHTLGADEEPGEPRRVTPPRNRPSDDEEIEDVAEEHRARRAGERPLGKL